MLPSENGRHPCILLSATIPEDPGYFGERMIAASNEQGPEWKSRSQRLQPSFLHTDILGALHLASQVFAEHVAARQILVIYSDMRNSTPELDLDTPSSVARSSRVLRQGNAPAASLLNVTVGALGVGAADRSIAYWQELQELLDFVLQDCVILWDDNGETPAMDRPSLKPLRGPVSAVSSEERLYRSMSS